ncbi:MAG: ABC transporter-like protein [Ignavibacteria bacterium]|nr:MAG: ABC transporter-like protein [Ignavibacteria bacterium]KAF0160646.1 MAG: ABC transporter-like protein [Ignavibacteria bacterium]
MKFENINKTFSYKNGLNVKLLNNISFEINSGEITSILASAGSGKTTLLKIICGLETADSPIKQESKFCFIPSKPSSFPWLNVKENILFANENLDSVSINSLIKAVGLDGYENHYPNNKSLGFRFRISLARALASNPKVLALDEPFASMDQRTKFEILQLIVDLNKLQKTTFLFATSNLCEALLVSHTTFLMKKESTGVLLSRKTEYQSDNVFERVRSDNYSKYLADEENLAKGFATQQSFTISL